MLRMSGVCGDGPKREVKDWGYARMMGLGDIQNLSNTAAGS
jgi:hypothetical protein